MPRPLARSNAAIPLMAAAICGMIPRVQPAAAMTLARTPRDSPAAMVKSAPVPGVATMSNDVSRNVTVNGHLGGS